VEDLRDADAALVLLWEDERDAGSPLVELGAFEARGQKIAATRIEVQVKKQKSSNSSSGEIRR